MITPITQYNESSQHIKTGSLIHSNNVIIIYCNTPVENCNNHKSNEDSNKNISKYVVEYVHNDLLT